MKRTLPWSENDSDSSSDYSSSSDTTASDDQIPKKNKRRSSKTKDDELMDLSKFGGLNVQAAFVNNGRKRLPIDFDKHTYKPVGNNEYLFMGCIENWIAYTIPPYHKDWTFVPANWVKGMYAQMEHFFYLDPYCYGPDWPFILTELESFCKRYYKDQKKKLKQHFRDVGGFKDVEKAKKHPPSHINSENWDKTIDYFLEVDRVKVCLDLCAQMTHDGSSSYSSGYKEELIANALSERYGNNQDKSTTSPPPPPPPPPPSGSYTYDDVKFIIDQFNEIVNQNNLNQQALLEAFIKGNPSASVPIIQELKPIVMPPPPPREPLQQPSQQVDDSGDDGADSKVN